MATTTRSGETRETLDRMMDGLTSDTDGALVLKLKVLELQFLREISDGLEAIQREIGFVPGPR